MRNSISCLILLGPAVSINAFAEVYLSTEQAANIFFPQQKLRKTEIVLTANEAEKIKQLSGKEVKSLKFSVLLANDGVVFTDQVIGKHELITYAVGIDKTGAVKGVEILEYRESYGGQIKRAAWRGQFNGKNKSSEVRAGSDIKTLSGATLSSTHVTDGVRRLIHTYEQIKNRL